jgi:hypothetical protein
MGSLCSGKIPDSHHLCAAMLPSARAMGEVLVDPGLGQILQLHYFVHPRRRRPTRGGS